MSPFVCESLCGCITLRASTLVDEYLCGLDSTCELHLTILSHPSSYFERFFYFGCLWTAEGGCPGCPMCQKPPLGVASVTKTTNIRKFLDFAWFFARGATHLYHSYDVVEGG